MIKITRLHRKCIKACLGVGYIYHSIVFRIASNNKIIINSNRKIMMFLKEIKSGNNYAVLSTAIEMGHN